MEFISKEVLISKLDAIQDGLGLIVPEILLAILILVVVLVDLVFGKRIRSVTVFTTVLGLAAVSYFTYDQVVLQDIQYAFWGGIAVTSIAGFLKLIFLLSAFITIWFNEASFYDRSKDEGNGEYYVLILATLLGLNLMVIATNLLILFLGLELVGLCSYALTIFRNDKKSKEAAIKYLLYGIFASAIMLYGMSFLYGFSGGLTYALITDALQGDVSILLGISVILFTVGALFKLAGSPFHVWVPDVYEGAPFPVVAFFSVAPKIAGIAVLGIFVAAIPGVNIMLLGNLSFERYLSAIAILTITIGNFGALWQKNVKRLMGYSSIAHAGFILIGIIAFSQLGINSLLYYIITYVFINFGAFLTIYLLAKASGSELIEDFSGLGKRYPWLGIAVGLTMLALVGLPPTSGFLAKLYIFSALYESWELNQNIILLVLLVIGLFNTVVSLFYYLRIPYYMYFKELKTEGYLKINRTDQIILGILLMPILVQFIYAGWFMNIIQRINHLIHYFL